MPSHPGVGPLLPMGEGFPREPASEQLRAASVATGSPQARPKSCTWPPRRWDAPLTQVAPSSPAQISPSSHLPHPRQQCSTRPALSVFVFYSRSGVRKIQQKKKHHNLKGR